VADFYGVLSGSAARICSAHASRRAAGWREGKSELSAVSEASARGIARDGKQDSRAGRAARAQARLRRPRLTTPVNRPADPWPTGLDDPIIL